MENAKLKVENDWRVLEAGDIVYLKSGGPAMVVGEIREIGPSGNREFYVGACWFDGAQITYGLFNPATLTRSKPED